jgi:hypothetical protein
VAGKIPRVEFRPDGEKTEFRNSRQSSFRREFSIVLKVQRRLMVNTSANRYDNGEESGRIPPESESRPPFPIFQAPNRGGDGFVSATEEEYLSAVESEGVERSLTMANRNAPKLPLKEKDDSPAQGAQRWELNRRKLPKLPQLQLIIMLPSHLELCAAILEEDGWDLNSLKCKVAVIQTFTKFENLQSTATTLIGMNWTVVKKTLVSGFCDSNFQRREIERQLQKLRF